MPADDKTELEHQYALALSGIDSEDVNGTQYVHRPLMLWLVAAGKTPQVVDHVRLHRADTRASSDLEPNIFDGLSKVEIDGHRVILVTSTSWGGGSGSYHYYDFYRPEGSKLQLIKSFGHERLEGTYFTIYKHAAYDASLICSRGEKHGKAYIYTCYLNVTKYAYDGASMLPVASAKLHERRGNRFLNEKYWFMSVQKALRNGEIFGAVR